MCEPVCLWFTICVWLLVTKTEATDRHTMPGRGCRAGCPAWRRGWCWPLYWTGTSCLRAAPVWLREGEEKKNEWNRQITFSLLLQGQRKARLHCNCNVYTAKPGLYYSTSWLWLIKTDSHSCLFDYSSTLTTYRKQITSVFVISYDVGHSGGGRCGGLNTMEYRW